MEQIVNLIINNGLGVASFVALLYFIFYYLKEMKETMKTTTEILSNLLVSMEKLTERIESLEKKD